MLQSRRKPKASSAIYVIDLTALFPKAVETLAKHCLWKWTQIQGTAPPLHPDLTHSH